MNKAIFKFINFLILVLSLNLGFISHGISKDFSNNKVPLIGSEQCRVILPLEIKNEDWKFYAEYIFYRLLFDNLKLINVRPDLVKADSVRFGFGFTLSCPNVFYQNLMHEFFT
ncbi:hypothetical protein AM589_03365 [Taylorella equigenitalis]|nr:hypothetical protein AM589_03365 [Taylorella equigenitalis]